MSTKISIVIAIELGLLVTVLGWLAVFGLPIAKPPVATAAEPMVESFAVVSPIDARLAAAEEEVDRLTRQVEDLEEPGSAASQGEEVYTEPAPTARLEYAETVGDLPDYPPVLDEPVATVSASFVQPVVEFVECPRPAQILLVSNQRVLARRDRPRLCQNGGEVVTPPRLSDRKEPRAGGGGVIHRPNPGPRTVAPTPRPSAKPMTSRPRQLAVTR